MADEFVDSNYTVCDFGDQFLVECPICGNDSQVRLKNGDAVHSCVHCGHSKVWGGKYFMRIESDECEPQKGIVCVGGPYDWYFHYPLMLRASCCGHVLWAYNFRHLDYLESFVSAGQRKSNPVFVGNRTLSSRLPKWMLSATNRSDVLRAISRIREKFS